MKKLRVLIACEFSGVVREAFRALGHDAWSCDLIPSEQWGAHILGDVREHLICGKWDLLIAHPPCTYLASSGARWFAQRMNSQDAAAKFFFELAAAPIYRICIENPVGVMSTRWRKPDQIIQPWQFGHAESKKTCLWLQNLPPLRPTCVLPLPAAGHWANQTPSGQNRLGPSPERAKNRARTYQGIASAMAEQWG